MNEHVLVTGGAGFIGSHTCKQLAASGYSPVSYDNLSTGNRQSIKWGPLIEGDIRDTSALESTLIEYEIDTIIHFAASAYVGESVSNPSKYYNNNVCGMVSLLDACVSAGVDKVIFSSSCATYGIPERLPILENANQVPINTYGRTKLIGEHMLDDYSAAYGIRSVKLRYFNACGADPDGELGEWHDPETHIIPRALMAAYGAIDRLDVFGTDYDTGDGTCERDYIHVSDLASAHLSAYQYLNDGGQNTALNLGTGKALSIKEILNQVKSITGRDVPVRFGPRRAGDPPVLFADPSLARSILNFNPQYSDIETIVRTAAPFFAKETVDAAGA